MKKLKVLITSPSLDTSKNIGGISNLTRLLIENDKEIDFIHFRVGKEDSQKRNIKWFLSQFMLLINYYRQIKISNIEITHVNYPLSGLSIIINLIIIIISKIRKTKIVIHLRGGELSLNSHIHKYQKLIIGKSIELSDKVIVLGEREKLFLKDFYDIIESKIIVLPNSVVVPDQKEIEKKISTRKRENVILKILFLGRIDKDKGLKEILSAFRSLNDNFNFNFLLAGTGPDKEWFVGECKKMLGEKFVYLGVLNYIEKIKVLSDSDIFILPSYFEGLPNALLEAMSYGLVPIVTPVGSIPEVVTDKIDGLIINIYDANDLKDKIELLINDINLLNNFAHESYNKIVSRYSISEYIDNLNDLYRKL